MRRLAGGLAVLLVLGALPARSAVPEEPRRLYVVQLAAEPLARTMGTDLDVRSPAADHRRSDLDSLEAQVLGAAGAADAPVAYRFRTALAGFAAWLTPLQHARLLATPGVAGVTRSRRIPRGRSTPTAVRHRTGAGSAPGASSDPPVSAASVDADVSGDIADVLGLPEGLWADLGGPDQAGDGIVIGIIDDGIVVDHPSFADQPVTGGVPNYIGAPFERPAGWNGVCVTGPRFGTCNNKVIGGRIFVEGFGADNVDLDVDELSPLSVDGHGVSVSGVAAGNYGVDPTIRGNDLGIGGISGVAPRAHIASYKVYWDDGFGSFLTLADLVAAMDTAVADGVDVINLSSGGEDWDRTVGATNVTDPVSAAALAALDAGILVVGAQGNIGPELFTSGTWLAGRPWVLSVGASTVDRQFNTTATIASGGPGADALELIGESLTNGLPATPLVAAATIPAPGVDPADAARCLPDTLDPVRAAGQAVFCLPVGGPPSPDRTVEPFLHVDQVLVAADAGAAAAVVARTPTSRAGPSGRGMANFPIPAVIVTEAEIPAIEEFLAGATAPTLALTPATAFTSGGGDRVSRFSARGPAPSRYPKYPGQNPLEFIVEGEFINPEVVAPAEEILVPTIPGAEWWQCFECAPHESWTSMRGTSFASPAVAGAAALLLDRHPEWNPSALRSALDVTAVPITLGDGVTPATPFDAGTGRIDPTRAATAGLVLHTSGDDFRRYQEGVDPRAVPGDLDPIEATDLNLPGIAFDFLAGPRTTRRTFTSVDPQPARWDVHFEGDTGLTVVANPATFTIAPGESQPVALTFEATTAPPLEYAFGTVVLTNPDDGRTLRIPVAVLPASANIVIPPVVAGEPSGRADVSVEAGFSGVISAVATGLAAPDVRQDQLIGFSRTPLADIVPRIGLSTFDIEVAPGTQLLQAQIDDVDGTEFWDELSEFGSDLDLYILRDRDGDGFHYPGDLVASSAGLSGFESVGITDPEPGLYRVAVHRFDDSGPSRTASYDLTTWVLADPSPDDLMSPEGPGLAATDDPIPVEPGDTVTVPVDYAGLSRRGTHLGIVTFYDSATPSPESELESRLVVLHHEP